MNMTRWRDETLASIFIWQTAALYCKFVQPNTTLNANLMSHWFSQVFKLLHTQAYFDHYTSLKRNSTGSNQIWDCIWHTLFMKCWGITSLSWEHGDWSSPLWSDSWWNLDAILHESHRHRQMPRLRKNVNGKAWKKLKKQQELATQICKKQTFLLSHDICIFIIFNSLWTQGKTGVTKMQQLEPYPDLMQYFPE